MYMGIYYMFNVFHFKLVGKKGGVVASKTEGSLSPWPTHVLTLVYTLHTLDVMKIVRDFQG